jgi:AraC-like DNA-binding protein
MEDDQSTRLDKLSDLARELEEIECRQGGVTDSAGAKEAREGLISAMRRVFRSHYEFAEWLDRYRRFYKVTKTWTVALEAIAAVQGCSARTLSRVFRNYDDARQLPLAFVDVMREEEIDPAEGENRKLVKALTTAPEPANHAEARATLKVARANVVKMKPAAANPPSELEDFAERIVRMFKSRYDAYSGADRDEQIRFVLERVVNVLHAEVRELRKYDRPDRVPKPAKGIR